MDAMILLEFVLTVVAGVGLLALALKFLDVHDQAAAGEEGKRTREELPAARSIVAKMPAFFGVPHAPRVPSAARGFRDRPLMPHEIDRRHVLWALQQANDDPAQAAVLLGTSEATFDLLVATHCGSSLTAGRGVAAPLQQPRWAVEPAFGGGPFAMIQNHIWAEQAIAREFVHLPSISSLYRPATPMLTTR